MFNKIREPKNVPHAPIEVYRGLAATHLSQGADGLYLFNHFAYSKCGTIQYGSGPLDYWHLTANWEPSDTGKQHDFLMELKNTAALKNQNGIFSVKMGWPIGESPLRNYPHNGLNMPLPVRLHDNSISLGLYFPYEKTENISQNALLVARVKNFESDEQLQFDLNGQFVKSTVHTETVPYIWGPFSTTPSPEIEIPEWLITRTPEWQTPEWLVMPIVKSHLKKGGNEIQVSVTGEVDILNIEVHLISSPQQTIMPDQKCYDSPVQ